MNQQQEKWLCSRCGRQLGKRAGDDKLEIRFSRAHQYLVTLPVTCVCPRPDCRTLNELRCPSKDQEASQALSPGQV